jgi:UDPglucose 6-dehydrogenase
LKICVQGLWHLGSVTAACLASSGHDVVGLDFNADLIQGLKAGTPPVLEPGLETMMLDAAKAGSLRFISAPKDIPDDIELLWIAYDTPVNDDDEADIEFVFAQIQSAMPHLPPGVTVLVSSQLPVGSVRRLEALARTACPEKSLGFSCSPENLRLGKALDVFLKPDRVIAGVRSARDKERIAKAFAPITDRIEWMSVESAEMTKHAINAFLATSVVFANEIASICETVGADAKEVERGLKSESRIGPKAYLSPGAAFAGGTLARDIEYLKSASQQHELNVPLIASVGASNDAHKLWARRKLGECFAELQGVTVAVWGLTYKPGTDTLRRSSAVEFCDWLIEQGARVRVHDPVVKALPIDWGQRVQRCDSELMTLERAQVLLIGTEWPQYRQLAACSIAQTSPGLIVLDPNRFLSSLAVESSIQYFAVGSPSKS